jgi:hypothetical protein
MSRRGLKAPPSTTHRLGGLLRFRLARPSGLRPAQHWLQGDLALRDPYLGIEPIRRHHRLREADEPVTLSTVLREMHPTAV